MHPNCFLWLLRNNCKLFITFGPFILNIKIYMHANLPASADENQLNYERVRFFSEMSEINWWWFIFNTEFYIHVNSPAWVDENRLKWEKVRFFSETNKTHHLALELIVVSSSWQVYMYIKFDIKNERLEWYKKRSTFAK